jgi:hypothetical protein
MLAQFRGGVPRGGGVSRGSSRLIPSAGARDMAPRGGGGGGINPHALPPGVHLVKGPPPPAAGTAARDAGQGAALSMGGGSSSGGVPPQVLGRGSAAPTPAAAMRGKMPAPHSTFSSPSQPQQHPPGVPMKMPPGMMGKKMLMPPGMSRPASPSATVRSAFPAAGAAAAAMNGGGGPSPSAGRPSPTSAGTPSPGPHRAMSPGAVPPQTRPPPLVSNGVPGSGSGPHPPQFAVVNGKKIMIPPGTKLPPGVQVAGKKMMMGGGGDTGPRPTLPSSGTGMKQPQHMLNGPFFGPSDQQQQQQRPPPAASASPSSAGRPSPVRPGSNPSPVRPMGDSSPSSAKPQLQPQPQQPPQHHVKKSGLMGGLSSALNFLKLGSDSDDDANADYSHRNTAPQLRGRHSSPPPAGGGGAGPSPPVRPSTSPTPPRQGPSPSQHQQEQPIPPPNEFIAVQGKKLLLPPGVKGPPHSQPLLPSPPLQQQQQQRGQSPAGPLRSGQPPPGAAVKMPAGSPHPAPPRSARSGSNAAELPSFSPSMPPPAAQPPHKVTLKAPPEAVVMKKVPVPPPPGSQLQSSGGSARRQSPERPPLASPPSSRSASVLTLPESSMSGEEPALPPQQHQRPAPIPPGVRIVKHMAGPPPPGAKLIMSPPQGAALQNALPQHPPLPSPAPAGMLRVPSSTILKDGEMPEAGVQTPPRPRRGLGESSEDSDEGCHLRHNGSNNRLSLSKMTGRVDSKEGSVNIDAAPVAVQTDSAGHDAEDEHDNDLERHGEEAEPDGEKDACEGDDTGGGGDGGSDHVAKQPSWSSSVSLRNRAKSPATTTATVRSSFRSASANAPHRMASSAALPLPPVRQTASSAARSAAAKQKKEEEEEAQKRKAAAAEEEARQQQRRAAAEAAQKRRQAKLAETRRTTPAKAEPPSPQEEDNTQKPPSIMDRSSASVVSTPSPSRTSSLSAASKHHSSDSHETVGDEPHHETVGSEKKQRGTPTQYPDDSQKLHHRRSLPSSPSQVRKRNSMKKTPAGRDVDSKSAHLTSRELYRLVRVLRDEDLATQQRCNDADVEKKRHGRRQRCFGMRSDCASDTGDDSGGHAERDGVRSDEEGAWNDWGLRPHTSNKSRSSSRDRERGRLQRHSLSATRPRQKQTEEEAHRRRCSLAASTTGIPWRYTSAGRSSEPFATPPPVRRPLGFINVGGGRYARVGGSPYATGRRTSATRQRRSASVTSIPLNISSSAYADAHRLHHARVLQNRSLLSDGLDPATSAILDAHDNAVVNEVRASFLSRRSSPVSGGRGGTLSDAYYAQQRAASIPTNSPLRCPSPVRQETGLNESVSTVDSQHPYCVAASALLPSMQALTPIRRPPSSTAQQQPQQRCHQPYYYQSIMSPPPSSSAAVAAPVPAAPTTTVEAALKPVVELSAEEVAPTGQPLPAQEQVNKPSLQLQQQQQSAEGNTNNATARTSAVTSPVSTLDVAHSPLAALRRSAFFEQLHRSQPHTHEPITSSAVIVGGSPALPPQRSGSSGSVGWEWVNRRRPTTPAESGVSSPGSISSAPYAPSSSQQQQQQQQQQRSASGVKKAAEDAVAGSSVPCLIPSGSTPANGVRPNRAPDAQAAAETMGRIVPARSRNSSARASTPSAPSRARSAKPQQQQRSSSNGRATSVGAAVAAAAAGTRSCDTHYNPDPYRPPSRTKEPARLTRATIARLSTPQQRRSGGPAAAAAAAMLSPITRRSNYGGGNDANSSTAQTCSKWLDEILGSTTVTATGVRAGGEGLDAVAAAAAGTLPIVDLRTEFKPCVAEIDASTVGGVGGAKKRWAAAAALALTDPDAGDYTRDFTGSRPRPHIPGVSFKHMVGVRTQSSVQETASVVPARGAGVEVKEVHGVEEGLPFEKYSSIRIHDPMRKSPWALAPEREGLDVLPGKPALSRRRRIPSGAGGGGSVSPVPPQGSDAGEGDADGVDDGADASDGAKRKRLSGAEGCTVVEEVHLDEYRRPYLVVRPVPSAEAAEAQRLAVERLSRPKPIYQRAERT